MVLQRGVRVTHCHQDEKEKEWPQQLNQEVDLGVQGQVRVGRGAGCTQGTPKSPIPGGTWRYRLPPAVYQVLPKEQHELGAERHGGGGAGQGGKEGRSDHTLALLGPRSSMNRGSRES